MHSSTLRAALLAGTAALTLAACRTEPTPADADVTTPPGQSPAPAAEGAVALERLASLHNSGMEDSARLVVRTAEEWAATWQRMHAGTTPVPAAPAVDFTRSLVLVAAMGTRSSGGHEIAVDSVVRRGAGLVAHVTSTAPGASCMTTSALTQPVAAVRVDATAADVTFEERQVVREC